MSKPEQYAVILGGLLGYRVLLWTLKRRQPIPSRPAAANAD